MSRSPDRVEHAVSLPSGDWEPGVPFVLREFSLARREYVVDPGASALFPSHYLH